VVDLDPAAPEAERPANEVREIEREEKYKLQGREKKYKVNGIK